MDGYIQAAAEAVADHGNTITDTHPHALAAACMQGAATIHAAEAIGDYMCRLSELNREGLNEVVLALKTLAGAIDAHGATVSTAIEVHADSIDCLADAIECSDGDLAEGAALLEMVAANGREHDATGAADQ
jgi:hypothetical protein